MAHLFTGLSERQNYLEVRNCLREASKIHSISLVETLIILDQLGQYKGIRKWFVAKDKKYRGSHTFASKEGRKSAENIIAYMPAVVTGARPGDILVGLKTQSLDAMIKIFDKSIPPHTEWLDTIRKFPDLWQKFLVQLGSINFYSGLSLYERELHLFEEQSDKDIYIQDVIGLKIQLLNVGSQILTKTGTIKGGNRSKFLDLSDEQIDEISSKPVLASSVQAMFPSDPSSRGLKGRTTLVFRRSIWKIAVTHKEVENYEGKGVLMKGVSSTLQSSLHAKGKTDAVYVIEGNIGSLGILATRSGRMNMERSFELVLSFHSDLGQSYNRKDITVVQKATKTFTPASFKSLLQKIVRFRPLEVDLGENVDHVKFPADFVLSVTFAILLNMPGFVPDIQRHVKGPEAAFKRLVVILFEDSYFEDKDEHKILTLLTSALLSQRIPSWQPTDELVMLGLKMAKEGLEDDRAFVFDITHGLTLPIITLDKADNELELLSVMMDEIKSFNSDLGMIRDIISNDKDYISSTIRPKIMPLEHCVDQHWAPEMVYFAPLEMVEKMKEGGSKPFSKIMRNVFGRVTGVNPRRPRRKGRTMDVAAFVKDFEDEPFVREVRRMQYLLLLSRQYQPQERSFSDKDEFFELEYELDRSWIAGMLGAIEVKVGRIAILVTLRPDTPKIFVAVRKPFRGMKTAILSEEIQEKAIKIVKDKMEYGYPLNKISAPAPELYDAVLILKDDKYWIRRRGIIKDKEWEKLRFSSAEITYIEKDLPLTLENAIRYSSDGQEKDSDNKLKMMIDETPSPILRRLLARLSGYKKIIEFERISRDGGAGNKAMVVSEDVGVYQFISKLTLLYPEALTRIPGSTLKFTVEFGPLLWDIRRQIQEQTEVVVKEVSTKAWGKIKDARKRELYQHQSESIEEMIDAHKLGRTGHFLYMSVGMGKTLIVFSYLKWLHDMNLLPPYVIYSLPPSAIETIRAEAEAMGLKYKLLVPTKTIGKTIKEIEGYKTFMKKGCIPEAYHINFILHDHLKNCIESELATLISDSIFVMDEVHKALGKTLRTSTALQLSRLSQEMIALTGTPVINNKTYSLNEWLEQIVPFEVNENNFWVAANGMVAKRAATGIRVSVKEIPGNFTTEEEKEYHSYVPPKFGGKNSMFGMTDFSKAFELSIRASTRKIISLAIKLIKKGEGVFILARNSKHQAQLKSLLLRKKIVPEKDIFLIGPEGFLNLTDETVKSGKVHDYKIVITTLQHVEGYNLTRLTTMITSVYPSNQASREQAEGRINRIGQQKGRTLTEEEIAAGKKPTSPLVYHVVWTGIQFHIYQHHQDAKSLSEVFSSLADETEFEI